MEKGVIFDIGAFDGIDGLALAIKNPKFKVFAFEANPDLVKKIYENKTVIENRIGRKIFNYQVFNKAVSNNNKKDTFFISKNPTGSSLKKFSPDLDKTWPGYRKTHFHVVKKINVDVITLESFCEKNQINFINYLHIDTQGNDLNVLKGLGRFIQVVQKGVLEAAIDKKNALYENNHTVSEVKSFFKIHNFDIENISHVDMNIKNEVNIKFINRKISKKIRVNLKYNPRYFLRVITKRTYLKDDIKDFLQRVLNFIKKG